MKKELSATAWMLKKYMTEAHINTFKDLAEETGIEYRTLMNHIENPKLFRILELRSLDEVLKIDPEDLIVLVKGGEYESKKKEAADHSRNNNVISRIIPKGAISAYN